MTSPPAVKPGAVVVCTACLILGASTRKSTPKLIIFFCHATPITALFQEPFDDDAVGIGIGSGCGTGIGISIS